MKASLLYACNAWEEVQFTLKNVEIIVVYYGDAFGTFRCLQKHYPPPISLYWHRRARTHQEALTFGLQQAHGTMVMRWDKHMEYFPDYVDKLYHPEYDFTYSKWWEGEEEVSPVVGPIQKRLRCYMWKTEFLRWMGGWTDHYPDHQDLAVLYRTLLLSNHTLYVHEALAVCHIKENRLLEYYMQSRMRNMISPADPRAFTLYNVQNLRNKVQELINLESFLFHHPGSYVLIDRCLNHYYYMENYPNAIFGKYSVKQAKDVDLHCFYTNHCDHPHPTMVFDCQSIKEALSVPEILYLFRCKRERCGSLLISMHYSAATKTWARAIQKELKQHLILPGDAQVDALVDVILWLEGCEAEEPLDRHAHHSWWRVFEKCQTPKVVVALPFLENGGCRYKFCFQKE